MDASKGNVKPPRKRGSRRGNSAPTIADVAREARCSPMTVSRVINGEGNVRAETREQVLAAVNKLNYSPNRAARSLAGGEQMRVALLFDNPSASYLSEFLMGAMTETSRRDIQLVVQNCDSAPEAKKLIGKLTEEGITGFLLPSPLCDDISVLELVVECGAIPIRVGPGKIVEPYAAVLIDDYQAAYDMTKHLIGLGHRRIGFIIGNSEQSASESRLRGYRAALEENGIEMEDALIAQGQFTYRSGMVAAEKLLSASPRPTAIFASNDDMAAATVAMVHRRHLDVPSDITVCGFDDTELASSIWPELTTIRQPIRAMTAEAVAMYSDLLRKAKLGQKSTPQHVFLDYTLVRRASDTGPSLVGVENASKKSA